VQKGAFDKALAEYQKLLRADPKDTNVRLKIGDLLLKKGDERAATEAYTQVAEIFTGEGFDAKAVAIYKQILKSQPGSVEARVRLGDLYQRLGLPSDALREFQSAAKAYQERGQKREAFDLLRRVSSLDPTNVPNRLSLADLFVREAMKDEAREEYTSLLGEVERAGSVEAIERVATRMLSTFPEDGNAIRALGQAKLTAGHTREAVELLRRALPRLPDDIAIREALVAAHEAQGDRDAAQTLWREIAELCKRRGDVDRARDILQRHAPVGAFLEPATPDGLELPSEAATDKPASSPVLTHEMEADVTPPPAGRGASDLVRDARKRAEFGNLDDGEKGARQALQVDAACDSARALLSDIATKRGNVREALRWENERRSLAQARGDGERLAEAEGRIRQLEQRLADEKPALSAKPAAAPPAKPAAAPPAKPAAAKAQPAPRAAPAKPGPPAPPKSGASVRGAPVPSAGRPARGAADELPDIELVLEEEENSGATEPAPVVEPAPQARAKPARPAPSPPGPAPGAPTEFEVTFDAPDADDEAEPEPEPPSEPEPPPKPPRAKPPSAKPPSPRPPSAKPPSVDAGSTVLGEHLAEAEFYFDQGMIEEAEAIYRRILARVPQHPQALVRIGEIEARRGEEGEAVEMPAPPPSLGDTAVEGDDEIPSLEGYGDEEETVPPAQPPASPKPVPAAAMPPPPKLAPAAKPPQAKPTLAPAKPAAKPAPTAPAKPAGPPVAKPAPRTPEPAAEPTAVDLDDGVDLGAELVAEDPALVRTPAKEEEGGDFDLAAELSEQLQEGGATTGSSTAEAFEDVFRAFKKGIEAHLGPEECEAHYDLAIAYKEMGLVEDAVRELEIVVRGGRRLEGLTLLAACKLELERPEEAIGHAREALALPGLPAEATTALRYELGVALAAAGQRAEALSTLEQVAAAERDFRDVADRIKELSRAG
jgi:tetratricopeptide (TPR) repeat protein